MRFVRQLALYYLRNNEDEDRFLRRAWVLVRLVVQEAWHRNLREARGVVMRSALCSLMLAMKDCEVNTLGNDAPEWGLFWNFTLSRR